MRIILNCFTCQNTHGLPNVSIAEYNDSGVFHLTCSRGHESTTVLQEEKFSLLFEIACHAINDGYYREAVSSFASSLERFFEYAVRVMFNHVDSPPDLFKSCWKDVASQSERQLGAFVFLWGLVFREKPAILGTSEVRFRNDVVHKGAIPTREEALGFGEAIVNVIAPLQAKLVAEASPACQAVLFKLLRNLASNDSQRPPVTATPNFFLRDAGDTKPGRLRDYVDCLRKTAGMFRELERFLGAQPKPL